MAGLLDDFVNTPAGIGLLSAIAGGMAGARRGQPVNSVGRGLAAGVIGYQNEKDNQRQLANTAIADKYRTMQMNEIEQRLAQQAAQQKWKAGLPAVMSPKLTGSTDQGRMLAEQNAAFGQEGLPALAESAQYAQPDAPLNMNYGFDQQAMQEYMMQPDSPYVDKIIEKQFAPREPIKLGAGDVLLDPNTKQPIYSAPSADKSPDKVRQYEYAVSKGFPGSYIDFLRIIPDIQASYTVPYRQAGLAIDQANLGLREREADYTLPRGKPRQQTAPSFSVTAPDGNVYGFPTQAAADQFKRSIGGQ